MNRLEWSWKARLDIIQIYNYIIEDSLYYSIKTVKEIREEVEDLKRFPYIGRKVPEYDIYNIRELIYKSYRIIYEIKSNEILIRRIWHSSRLLSK
jgi:plasmid stabilization system protein ParE